MIYVCKKGACLFILKINIKYYTKEICKLIRIMTIGFVIILAVIAIKFKPEYKVSMNEKSIGFVSSESDIDKYIEEIVENAESEQIAFVNLENTPNLKLQLVSRNKDMQEEVIKEELEDNLTIEYISYAIAINGENKTFLASNEEAQNIVDEIKEDYAEEYTKDITILPVYSETYSEIASVGNEVAKDVISNEVKTKKEEDEKAKAIKLAAAKKAAAKKVAAQKAIKATSGEVVANDKKEAGVNGINFTVKPVTGTITSRFGRRSSPGGIGSTNHKGLDIAAPNGTAIHAAASGTVSFSGYNGSLGNLVIINHGNGVQTCYGHCSKLYVSVGQTVNAGDCIAAVGKTGAATGYHLHFEVRINGTQVNPQKYIY